MSRRNNWTKPTQDKLDGMRSRGVFDVADKQSMPQCCLTCVYRIGGKAAGKLVKGVDPRRQAQQISQKLKRVTEVYPIHRCHSNSERVCAGSLEARSGMKVDTLAKLIEIRIAESTGVA